MGGTFSFNYFMNNFGGESGSAGAGGSGHADGSTVFMSYAGPIMPLSLSEKQDITAERKVVFDFSNQDNAPYSQDIRVEDGYVLSNNTDKDVSTTAIYPFASTLREVYEYVPNIMINGVKSSVNLRAGGYDGFKQEGKEFDSFLNYKTLLYDGKYKSEALNDYTPINTPVIVYEFSNFKAPLNEYQAATQNVDILMDYSKTRILSYGFNGGGFYPDENKSSYCYFVPDESVGRNLTKMLIVIGDDIDYTLSGYKTGATEKDNELEGVSSTVTRYESKLSDVLSKVIKADLAQYKKNISDDRVDWTSYIPEEMLLRDLSKLIDPYITLNGNLPERYDYERLDDMVSMAYEKKRVLYLSFDVVIPAGQSITISADMIKARSFDFYCSNSKNIGVKGFDMATVLDSNIDLKEQSASLINYENIEIVRQNFGFDLLNGKNEVILDNNIEHYYLEVKDTKK